MPLQISSGFGATALDLSQLIDARDGWAVDLDVAGACAATITSQATREIQVADGPVFLNGVEHDFVQDTIALDAPDATDPRRDVIYIDSFNQLAVETGDPKPYYPDPSTADVTIGPWDVFSPYPHSMEDINGTVVAEVLVPADGTDIQLRDRRMDARVSMSKLTADRAQVNTAPVDDTDVMRLADTQDSNTIDNHVLGSNLDAAGYDIHSVGTLSASTVKSSSAPKSGNDAVRYTDLSAYYLRSGDSLRGTMNANNNDITNADDVEANTVTATNAIDIPVSDGVPSEGMLWWNTQES